MSASILLLISGVLTLLVSLAVLSRGRRPGGLLIPRFFFGWLGGELAPQGIVFGIVWTGLLLAVGGAERPPGQVGLVGMTLGLTLLAWAQWRSLRARETFRAALAEGDIDLDAKVPALVGAPWPFSFKDAAVRVERGIEYGPVLPGDQGGRNQLDLRRPVDARPGDKRPVLLQIHGGAWMIGDKREQGLPLMTHLAGKKGWVCVAINYRLCPQATMPDPVVDVFRAIRWIKTHIEEYGGDPDFIAVTGGSAGGHLTAMAGLASNDPRFQPGFEDLDTRVQAAVPFYGVFDFLDRAGDRGKASMADALGPRVFKCLPDEDPELWDSVCPISRIHENAPPFFVIQGTHDSLVFVEEARTFVKAMREKSGNPVLYAELDGAQHAFDIFHSVRSAHAVQAVTAFLERVYDDHRKQRDESGTRDSAAA